MPGAQRKRQLGASRVCLKLSTSNMGVPLVFCKTMFLFVTETIAAKYWLQNAMCRLPCRNVLASLGRLLWPLRTRVQPEKGHQTQSRNRLDGAAVGLFLFRNWWGFSPLAVKLCGTAATKPRASLQRPHVVFLRVPLV